MQPDTFRKVLAAFRGLFGSYKRSIAVLFILGLLGGLLESVGVSILVPLFAHILQQPLAGTGFIIDAFEWFFAVTGLEMRLKVLLPLIVIAFAFRGLVQWGFDYMRTSITTDYERNMRRDLYHKLLAADWSFLIKQKLGHAENEMMVGVTATTKLLSNITSSILSVTSLCAYIAVALTISVGMTLATIVAGGVVLFMFKPFLRKARRYGGVMVTIGKELAHDINESVLGLKSIKATARERAVGERMLAVLDRFRSMRMKQVMMAAVTKASVQPLSVLIVAAAFAYAFNRPGFDLASFIVIIFLIQRIFLYVDRAQSTLQEINQEIPFASSVIRFMHAFDEHKEKRTGTEPFLFNDKIEFRDVSFWYREKDPVLSHVTLTIRKGETLGIIGPSGAGKTTIADLLLRLLRPTAGSVTMDAVPFDHIALTAWRERIAYVSQNFFLLNDSIANNVRFYDDSIDEEAVQKVLEVVELTSVIAKLPQGIHTSVGEQGIELSAGQRQRIALARALAQKPDVLILDEATSSLDGESERAIHDALQKLHGSITMVIIAHRLSTVMETDRIAVVEEGGIAEVGAPQELLADKSSYFYRLTHLQSQEPST